MRNGAERDETTLRIVTALVLFAVVLGAGGVLLAVGSAAFGVQEAVAARGFPVVVGAAAVIAVGYLLRGRTRG